LSAAIIAFIAMATVSAFSGSSCYTCCLRGLAGAAGMYIVAGWAWQTIVTITYEALGSNQHQNRQAQDGSTNNT
jgi:uncharacterized membrane protein